MNKTQIQKGFSLITAIFLLVVLSALGTMMVTFYTAQQQSSTIDILGARAYQAARAGIEWGTFQITQSGVVGKTFATACQTGTPQSSVSLAGTPLSQLNLAVSCSSNTYSEGASSAVVYTITATASGVTGSTPGSADFVQRVISAVAAGDTASGVIYQRERY